MLNYELFAAEGFTFVALLLWMSMLSAFVWADTGLLTI